MNNAIQLKFQYSLKLIFWIHKKVHTTASHPKFLYSHWTSVAGHSSRIWTSSWKKKKKKKKYDISIVTVSRHKWHSGLCLSSIGLIICVAPYGHSPLWCADSMNCRIRSPLLISFMCILASPLRKKTPPPHLLIINPRGLYNLKPIKI